MVDHCVLDATSFADLLDQVSTSTNQADKDYCNQAWQIVTCNKYVSNAAGCFGSVGFSPCEVLVCKGHAKNGAMATEQLVLWQFL
jgi:hypothetical protein